MARSYEEVLQSLRKATTALRQAQGFLADVGARHQQESLAFRMAQSGFIQHFEFTFELARNVIQRWLREHGPRQEDVDLPVTRRDLFRMAARVGLIDHPDRWFKSADARNASSHTYTQSLATEVQQVGEGFIDDVELLLHRCAKLHD